VQLLAPAGEFEFTAQLSHDDAPLLFWNLPGAHAAHVDEFGAPSTAEYVPARHLVQDSPLP
jgi:hypothetical protein